MLDLLFPNKKDLEKFFRSVAGNPLLAALLMINPFEAFKLLNLVPQIMLGFLPSSGEDAQLADLLVQALRAGRTTLDQPQVFNAPPARGPIVTPPPPAEPAPVAAEQPARPAALPAMTLSIATGTLQRALQLYAASNFAGKEFLFPAQSWLDVTTKGQSIALDLQQGRARVVAHLQGTMALKLAGMQFDLKAQNVSFPIEVSVLAALKLDAQNRLFVNVTEGAVNIGSTPLPARLAADLIAKITDTIGSIPIVQVPGSIEIPGDPPAQLALQLDTIGIAPAGLTLEFHL